jgi:hypothetical protein
MYTDSTLSPGIQLQMSATIALRIPTAGWLGNARPIRLDGKLGRKLAWEVVRQGAQNGEDRACDAGRCWDRARLWARRFCGAGQWQG